MDAHQASSNHRRPIALAEKVIDPEILPGSIAQGPPLEDGSPNASKHHQNSQARGVAWIFIVLSVLSSTFLFALDNTVVADLQPVIVEQFEGTAKLPWVAVAFAMGGVSVNLLWGKLYGEFDNKYIFIAATFVFEVGSAICGAAPSMNVMIVGRAIAGLGGGGIYIGTINILTAFTSISERPLYMSFVGATWSSGTVLGPVIGGAFAESGATWRWAFYINLCVAALAAPVYILVLPSHCPQSDKPLRERIRRLDYCGIVLFIGASVSLVMAISFGGTVYAWNSGQIIGLFVCTGILWLLFCGQQLFCVLTTKVHRLFPVEFLQSYEMWILFAEIAACIACIFIPVYFIPLFFQFVRQDSALKAGVRLLPFVLVAVFGAMINGAVMERYGLYMPWFAVGGTLVAIGGGLLYTIELDSSVGRIYGYSVITALGTGFFVQAPFSVAHAKVRADQVPAVTAFISCGQIGGITLSLAIATSAFVNQASDKIALILPDAPPSAIHETVAGVGASFFQAQTAADQREILMAIVSSIDHIYIMVMVGGAVAVLLSLGMKRERLFLKAAVAPGG